MTFAHVLERKGPVDSTTRRLVADLDWNREGSHFLLRFSWCSLDSEAVIELLRARELPVCRVNLSMRLGHLLRTSPLSSPLDRERESLASVTYHFHCISLYALFRLVSQSSCTHRQTRLRSSSGIGREGPLSRYWCGTFLRNDVASEFFGTVLWQRWLNQ